MDARMPKSMLDDHSHKDLGFVDINYFSQLQSRFENLNKSHEIIDQNVTMLTELITNFIKMHFLQKMWAMH